MVCPAEARLSVRIHSHSVFMQKSVVADDFLTKELQITELSVNAKQEEGTCSGSG